MTVTHAPSVFNQVLSYANRADPYPLYAELRKTPVARQEDGSYVVSTYREITQLLHDPRISSDQRNLEHQTPAAAMRKESPAFIGIDPPEHDRLRRMVMRHFGPPDSPGLVDSLLPSLNQIVTGLIDGFADRDQVDIVDDFAYPFPVTVICHLLGVPREDEPRFHEWVEAEIAALDSQPGEDPAEKQAKGVQARTELMQYLAGLAAARRQQPTEDLISKLVHEDGPDGRMSDADVVSAAHLLLIAGHETTVNLIANGVLTLLRNPAVMERIRREPDFIIPTIEELLRYEGPVHFIPWRTPFIEVTIGGVTIPKGATVSLVLAAGNRDPEQFDNPDRFDPTREDNQHLGLGGGIHSCFGAPLARLEGQIALGEFVRRVNNPRLVTDPPPYRQSPILRGPRHLMVEFDGLR
jgi:cytochrome P450